MKNGKALGSPKVQIEMLKVLAVEEEEWILDLLKAIWEEEVMPSVWEESDSKCVLAGGRYCTVW